MGVDTRSRTGKARRESLETNIEVSLALDGSGNSSIETGVPFFNHMLASWARHSGLDLEVNARGDTEIDDHHTVEDTALVLGKAFLNALGDRASIARFGHAYVPMDEALARCVVDISGRPFLVYKAESVLPYAGQFQTYLAEHFFRSFAQEARITLHVELMYGTDPHHALEAMFKAFALATRRSVALTGGGLPSTKGVLD